MVSYDLSYVFKFLPEILYALPLTLWILIVTIVIGSLLGALLAWGQLYGDEVIVSISKGYVFVLRCTPPIVLLFMVFYGLPEFLEWWLGLDVNGWSRTVFVITA
ncbi:MAG: ABC transporter permease subunit, partial [Streptococcus suis]